MSSPLQSSPIAITLNTNDWKAIQTCVSEYCKTRDAKWNEWAHSFVKLIERAIQRSSVLPVDQRGVISINLNSQTLETIHLCVRYYCQKVQTPNWLRWGQYITQKIEKTIGKKLPALLLHNDESQDTVLSPSEESIEILRRALTLWQKAGDNPNESEYYNFVSLVQLAIDKAGKPIADFHSILAQVHFDMNNFDAAWFEAGKTLAIDNDDFKAQWIKSILAFDLYLDSAEQSQDKKVGFLNAVGMLAGARGFRQGQEAGRKIGESIGSKRNVNQSWSIFIQEMNNLVMLFSRICNRGIEASDFTNFSQRLITLADGMLESGIPLKGNLNLYGLVASIPTGKVVCETDEEKDEVQTVQLIAQGRMSL